MNQILKIWRWDFKLYILWVNHPRSLHHAYIPHSHPPSQRAIHFISCTVLTFADIAVRPHFSASAVILGGRRTVRAGLERAVFGLVQVKDIADITEESRRGAVGAGVHTRWGQGGRERGGVKLKACISHSDACLCWHSKTIPAWKAKVWDQRFSFQFFLLCFQGYFYFFAWWLETMEDNILPLGLNKRCCIAL